MADSIKVQTLHKLVEILQGVSGVGSVHLHQGKPIDLDHVKLPALYLVEEEEVRGQRNRLAIGQLKFQLGIFIRLSAAGSSSFTTTAYNLQARIHNALATSGELNNGLAMNYREEGGQTEFPNDEFGVLYLRFTLTYGHAWGDAFTTAY